ncbi:MAG: hypothetical protein LBR71_02165, partial [Synergistaceae bacterium]|nr:hypothetical protein [Synergistaceae bacterium]
MPVNSQRLFFFQNPQKGGQEGTSIFRQRRTTPSTSKNSSFRDLFYGAIILVREGIAGSVKSAHDNADRIHGLKNTVGEGSTAMYGHDGN